MRFNKNDKIYYLRDNEYDPKWFEEKIRELGYTMIPLDGPEQFLNLLKGSNEKESPASYSQEGFILSDHIAGESQRKFLQYLFEYSHWLIKMMNDMGIGLLISDGKNPFIMNKAVSNLIKEEPNNLRHHPIRESVKADQKEALARAVQRLVNREIRHYQRELLIETHQQETINIEVHGLPLDLNSYPLIVEFLSAKDLTRAEQLIATNEEIHTLIRELHSLLHGLGKIVSRRLQPSQSREKKAPRQLQKTRQREKYKLTHREIQILKYIYEGHTSQQIAEKLYISKRTVESHRANILHKTNSKNTADLIRFALQHKLL